MKLFSIICISLIAAESLVYADPKAPDQSEDVEIQATVDQFLPKIRDTKGNEREDALRTIHNKLQTIKNKKHKFPKDAVRKRLSRELVKLYRGTSDKDFPSPSSRLRILAILGANGDNEIAKPFLLEILKNGIEGERNTLLNYVGSHNALAGDDVYDEMHVLAKNGKIKKEALPAVLARLNKKRALPELLSEVESSNDKRMFLYSAWALQDYYRDPQNYKRVLPRLRDFGLNKSGSFDDGGDGIFWLDNKLLLSYVAVARGSELQIALELLAENGSLTPPESVPTLIALLGDKEPKVRELAAKALGNAAEHIPGKTAPILAALGSTLKNEDVERVRGTIAGVIGRIERFEKGWKRVLEKSRGTNP